MKTTTNAEMRKETREAARQTGILHADGWHVTTVCRHCKEKIVRTLDETTMAEATTGKTTCESCGSAS